MRWPILIPCLAAALGAQDARGPDPREMVRKAIELDRRNAELERNYTYQQRQEERELDASDKAKKVTIRTFEVSMQEGSPYRRLLARDDQPLTAEGQKQEDERMHFTVDERRKESAEQRARRIAEWKRREQKRREPVAEVPDAFDFKLAGEETIDGAECYVIDATPKPGYKPKSTTAGVLTRLAGRMWIAKQDYGWVKADMQAGDTISVGGFLLRLSKGSRIVVEQTRIENGLWLPKSAEIKFFARLLLVKGLREDLLYQFNNYRKTAGDARAGETRANGAQ